MDARFFHRTSQVVLLQAVSLCWSVSCWAGAGYRTPNFAVDAPSPQLAHEIGNTAERLRRELAQEWLGKELPQWSKPCPIKARVAPQLGAGGATSFVFDHGEVFGWRMEIQGSRERILDSVLPHEITHTIFACHFRQPLPRWADEGACTTVEHPSEISKQERMLIEFLQTQRGIPFDRMFAMQEYPHDVLPLYAQGHSLSRFLIGLRGKRDFLAFLGDGLQDGNWPRALHKWYGYRDLVVLQKTWLTWIKQGQPDVQLASNVRPGLAESPSGRLASNQVVRGQDPGSSTEKTPWQASSNIPVTPTPEQQPQRSPWPAGGRALADASVTEREPTVYEALSKDALQR